MIDSSDPERALALSYALAERRPALGALWALDETLARIVATTREPALGAMRLLWWRDALERLDGAPPPAEPVLAALHAHVLPLGVTGKSMAAMEEGWTAVLPGQPIDDDALTVHARARGERLFALSAEVLGQPMALPEGGGWALVDLSFLLSDRAAASRARALGKDRLASRRWPRPLRPLGALTVLARMDAEASARQPGAPGRVLRLLRMRLTGA